MTLHKSGWLSQKDLSQFLNISIWTIRRWSGLRYWNTWDIPEGFPKPVAKDGEWRWNLKEVLVFCGFKKEEDEMSYHELTEIEKLLKTNEVAEMLRCTHYWVRKLAIKGDLDYVKLGNQYRFRYKDVLDLLNKKRKNCRI